MSTKMPIISTRSLQFVVYSSRLNNSGLCQVITMTVPRKSELFQEDLYPDTVGDEPACTCEEWLEGKDVEPLLISLRDGYKPSASSGGAPVIKKNVLDKMPPKKGAGKGDGGPQPDKTLTEFAEEIRKLKAMIVKHENRIRALEADVAMCKACHQEEETHSAHPEDEGPAGDGLGVAVPPNADRLAPDEV